MADGLRLYFEFLWFLVRYLSMIGFGVAVVLGLSTELGDVAALCNCLILTLLVMPMLIFCGNPNWRIAKAARWWLYPPK